MLWPLTLALLIQPAPADPGVTQDPEGHLTGYTGERPPKLTDRNKRSDELKADIAATVLPTVRLTPPVTEGADVLDLAGDDWLYAADIGDDFAGGLDEIGWANVSAPGHFALQGHEKMHQSFQDWSGRIAWAKRFEVPKAAAGARVYKLQFGSVDGAAKFYLNGRLVGEVSSAFLPVELDVTDALNVDGGNELAVTIEKDELTSWIDRPLGGIGRYARLVALPEVNLARLHADTGYDAQTGGWASVMLTVANEGGRDLPAGREVALTIFDDAGRPVAESVHPLPAVAAGDEANAVVRLEVPGAEPWHPETPAMYGLRATLSGEGPTRPGVTAERAIGFVSVSTDGGVLSVNGTPFTMKGTNYHTTQLGYAHDPTPEMLDADVARFVRLNHNALRPWPSPNEAYVDSTDRRGIFTTIEVPVMSMLYGKGKDGRKGEDLALTGPYLELTARTLEAYRSHPSVLTWGLANESIYYEYFERAARGIEKADPTRPVFFAGDHRIGLEKPGLTLGCDHYPKNGRVNQANTDIAGGHWDTLPTDVPTISTEWCHVPWNNTTEIAHDPAIDLYFGHYALAHVNESLGNEHLAGGMIFVSMPLRAIDRDFDFGFFTANREPTALSHVVAQAYSPVRLLGVERGDDSVTLAVQNLHDVTDLADVRVEYLQGEARGSVELSAAPGETATFTVPFRPGADAPLWVTYVDPKGTPVDVHEVPTQPRPVMASVPATPLELTEDDGTITIAGGEVAWEIDRATGRITAGRLGGGTVVTDGPLMVANNAGYGGWPTNDLPIENQLTGWRADNVAAFADEDGSVVVGVEGAYEQAAGSYTMIFRPGGELEVGYSFAWEQERDKPLDVFELGVALDVTAAHDTLAWQREPSAALWTYFPPGHLGRLRGTAARMGDPATLADRQAWERNDPRPWGYAEDLIESAGFVSTRDFRATKFHVNTALLHDGTAGVAVTSNGRHNAHATPTDTGHRLLAGVFHNGGTEFHLIKSVRRDVLKLEPGDVLEGSVIFRLGRPTD